MIVEKVGTAKKKMGSGMAAVSLKDSLFTPVPVEPVAVESLAGKARDPLFVVQMYIDIGQIDNYKYNPRHAGNERFLEIKESIRERGLDHPLPISRIAGEERYFVYKGGNTRLTALRELLEETDDARFKTVRCEFHPFKGHAEGVAAHLRENLQRGNMSFIDMATGMVDFRHQREADLGETLSLRAWARELQAAGFGGKSTRYDASYLSKLDDAVRFKQYLPQAAVGFNRPLIESLRKLAATSLAIFQFGIQKRLFDENLIGVYSVHSDEKAYRHEVFGAALAATDRAEGWGLLEAEGAIMAHFLALGMDDAVWRELYPQAFAGNPLVLPDTEGLNVQEATGDVSSAPIPVLQSSAVNPLTWKVPEKLDTAKGSVEVDAGMDSPVEFEADPVEAVTVARVAEDGKGRDVRVEVSPVVAETETVAVLADRVLLAQRLDNAITGVAGMDAGVLERLALPDELRELVDICLLMASSLGGE